MTTPYWVQDAIFYQIFPDRFANGDPTNDPPNVHKWGEKPTLWGFQGGDLRGIIQKLDYLLDLGVNALYLNPIFESASTHRYNTNDYYLIDRKLGKMTDFNALIDAAHKNGMRVILDGVFNHCGRGFFAFTDVVENDAHSPYRNWFHINGYPLDACGQGEAKNYLGWWGYKSLPKFNTDNPQVRQYIMDIGRYWIERGADGWRLDVPNEIDDDDFWAEFRHVVKNANPDAYILGEIWTIDPRWTDDKHFDGLMHYPVRDALLEILNGKIDAAQFADKVEGLFKVYPRDNVYAMYLPLGSHDTERLATMLHNDLDKIKQAFLFQFSYPGAPAIYYADEIGLEGGKDPDCRRAFPWDSKDWKGDLRPWVQQLISLRKRSNALRRGDFKRIAVDSSSYTFSRSLGNDKVLVALNLSPSRKELRIPVQGLWQDGQTVRSWLDNRAFGIVDGHITITLDAWGSAWVG